MLASWSVVHFESGKGRRFILIEYDPVSKSKRKEKVLEPDDASRYFHEKFREHRKTNKYMQDSDRNGLLRDVAKDGGLDADRDVSLGEECFDICL